MVGHYNIKRNYIAGVMNILSSRIIAYGKTTHMFKGSKILLQRFGRKICCKRMPMFDKDVESFKTSNLKMLIPVIL